MLADDIRRALRAHADPERAAKERAYLKSDLTFLGAGVPAVRRVVRDAARQAGPLTHDAVVGTAAALWADRVHEHRQAAVELLAHQVPLLAADDLPFLESLLRTAGTWALVDGIAPSVVGPVVERQPDAAGPVLDRWATDDDFWLRRAAMLALLVPLRRGGGDWARFTRYADPLLEDREFFVRKAIGWILRDVSRRHPDLVVEWCLPRARRLSGVTYREVVRHLDDAHRAALDAERRA